VNKTQTTKILLYNSGYATGLDGSLKSYLLHFLRYIYTPKKVVRDVISSIDSLVNIKKPDVCCLVEIRRVGKFIRRLWEYPFHEFANKYGARSLRRHMPFFRKNSIGFFSDKYLPFHKHYLHCGAKKLIYEIALNHETSLIMGHLSLRKRTRRKQLCEIKEMIGKRKHVILCGDFNIFKGLSELEDLIKECGLRIVNTLNDVTFPASHPDRALDLFLCSEGIRIESLEVLPVKASDHLPVLLEVQL
jgi:hypothetical protein